MATDEQTRAAGQKAAADKAKAQAAKDLLNVPAPPNNNGGNANAATQQTAGTATRG